MILSVDLRCEHHREACACVGDLLYRHGCVGCGHLDAAHTGENDAVEDAMDHAWSGWRDLPVLAGSMPQDSKKATRWLEGATEHYPESWIERGGPVRTARGGCGTRHVPDRTPFGGYDMGAQVTDGHYATHLEKSGLYNDRPEGR